MADNPDLIPIAGSGPQGDDAPQAADEGLDKQSKQHIPRPRNAFILFRSHQQKLLTDYWKQSGQDIPHNCEVSKIISFQWKKLTPEEKKEWHDKAEQEKHEHAKKYPGYKYKPKRKKNRNKLALEFELQNLVRMYPHGGGTTTTESAVPGSSGQMTNPSSSSASMLPPQGGTAEDQLHFQQQVAVPSAGSQTSGSYLMQLAPWENRFTPEQQLHQHHQHHQQHRQHLEHQQQRGLPRGYTSDSPSSMSQSASAQISPVNFNALPSAPTPKIAYPHENVWKPSSYRQQQAPPQYRYQQQQQQQQQQQHQIQYMQQQQHLQPQHLQPQHQLQQQQLSQQHQSQQTQHRQQPYYRLPNIQQDPYIEHGYQHTVVATPPTSAPTSSSSILAPSSVPPQPMRFTMPIHQTPAPSNPSPAVGSSTSLQSNISSTAGVRMNDLGASQPDNVNPK
ncbi:HBL143Wp [Eremothecium sinecaudum]|uniref:HBL143Wp n=1 Tax=Eremothecium sinecaudum TaxID=45286 RepID=A0A109UWF0_9SACH|nr:HBL143Wp [Eremothecium sinecaudum]AMD18759.1 HBL143Wp [Eremothecium sinecaudum]